MKAPANGSSSDVHIISRNTYELKHSRPTVYVSIHLPSPPYLTLPYPRPPHHQGDEAASPRLSAQEAAVVRDAVRDFNHETRKSAELAAREADVEARAYAAWVEARKKGDWESFAPAMEEASGMPSVREHQLVEERVLRD